MGQRGVSQMRMLLWKVHSGGLKGSRAGLPLSPSQEARFHM